MIQTAETLAEIAIKFPQTVYAGFCFCLQSKWQYVQRVISDTAAFFVPLETAIETKLIPALLEINSDDVSGDLRQVFAHGVKQGGLAIRNPVDTASYVHEASKQTTSHLTLSLVDPNTPFLLGTHKKAATDAPLAAAEIGF